MGAINEFSYLDTRQIGIANGQSLSGAVDLDRYGIVRIEMPAAWTAADLTFSVSSDGVTYVNLYDGATGDEVTIKAAASRAVVLDPATFGVGFRYLKVRSGTSGAAVNQGAARTLLLVVRPV